MNSLLIEVLLIFMFAENAQIHYFWTGTILGKNYE